MLFDLLVVSAAVLLNGRTAVAQDGSPCSSVSSMSSAYMSMFPEETQAVVPADAAHDCLKSVPVDKDELKGLIDEMQYYLNWQSNLAYLIEPPEGYTEDRVDIADEMKKIKDGLDQGTYEDDYTVMFDLSMAWTKSYDFHMTFVPDIMQIFRFRRGNVGLGLLDEFALVSVSSDGKALPELYNYYDIMVSTKEGWEASPITEINNKSAEDYVQNWSKQFDYHEDHTRYNMLFPNQAQISTGSRVSYFGRSNIPDGDVTTVKHKNGTVNEFLNNAIVELDALDDIEDGESLFNKFCNQLPSSTNNKRGAALREHFIHKRHQIAPTKRQDTQPTATGFPKPEILHSEAVIGGYYLSGSGYDDVAVLSVPSFSPETDEGPAEFQDLIGQFLKDATGKGKKRLVIDLRGNGGGRVFLGYDLFKQLFPSLDPYGASQFRANEAFEKTGELFNENTKDITYEQAVQDVQQNGLEGGLGLIWQSIFNYRLPLTVDNKNFTSWQEYFGPHEANNDKFTTVSRKDLNNFFSDDLTLDVTGYRTRADKLNTNQPFEAKNIVLLQDGGCGSTCAVFSEFMKYQGAVQQVVVGGKPQTGPMQGVTGSKGSQVYSWTKVYREAALVYENLPDHQEELNQTEVGKLLFSERPLKRTAYQESGESFSSINLRDNIRMDDKTNTPLEFIYEAADCRLFYTGEMIRDPVAVWKKTVDAHWGDAKQVCVDGSTGDKSSLSGGAQTASGAGKKAAATTTRVSGALTAAVVGVAALFVML